MNFKGLLTVFILIVGPLSNVLTEDICDKYKRELAAKQSAFVQCSTLHSVPVRLCNGCELQYSEMQAAYLTMRGEKNCTEKFFDKDRINIVSTTQAILTSLWNKAYCDDCFTTNNSQIFDEKLEDFEFCLLKYKGEECVSCLSHYLALNGFYVSLDKKNNGQVCYDMQDSMNRTREHWSKELKCCRRQFNILIFVITCGFAAVLPILFYSSTYALTKRNERNYDFLIEDPRQNHPSSIVNASSSVADLPSTSSAATCRRVPSKENCEDSISSDDSAFEEAVGPKIHNKS